MVYLTESTVIKRWHENDAYICSHVRAYTIFWNYTREELQYAFEHPQEKFTPGGTSVKYLYKKVLSNLWKRNIPEVVRYKLCEDCEAEVLQRPNY